MPLIQNFKDNVSLQYEARTQDTLRILKALNPVSTSGAAFAAKQALLNGTVKNPQEGALKAASALAAILAQIPVAGTGTHFLINEFLDADISTYIGSKNAASEAKNNGKVTIKLNSKKMLGTKTFDELEFGGAGQSDAFGKLNANELLVGKDTVPVRFSVQGTDPSSVQFRGFIQGITNNYSGNWIPSQYVGRSEPLYTQSGATRTLNFTLLVPIFSAEEQYPVYERVNTLISYIYPRYQELRAGTETAYSVPQGNIVALSIGDYFNQFGVITNITDTVEVDFPWSSKEGGDNETNVDILLPQVIKLSISMNVLHRSYPERQNVRNYNTLPFIGNNLETPYTPPTP